MVRSGLAIEHIQFCRTEQRALYELSHVHSDLRGSAAVTPTFQTRKRRLREVKSLTFHGHPELATVNLGLRPRRCSREPPSPRCPELPPHAPM